MTQEQLNEILEKHKKWLKNDIDGERANLSYADLKFADLRGAIFRHADLTEANLTDANLTEADLAYADFTRVNLTGTDITKADLAETKLDFSSLPLWCGSLTAHFDDRQLAQIAYHLCKAGLQSKNASDDTKAELSKLISFANKFYRAEECGRILS